MKGTGNHFLFGQMDLLDQLIMLLVGVALLAINLGWLPSAWLAYWPVILIVMAFKEMLQNN
jgi:hypothetical protein